MSDTLRLNRVCIQVHSASDLIVADHLSNSSDPYVVVKLAGQRVRTKTIMKSLEPVWDAEFTICTADAPVLHFEVWDWDRTTPPDPLGDAILDLRATTSFSGALKLQRVASGQLNVTVSTYEIPESDDPSSSSLCLYILDVLLEAGSETPVNSYVQISMDDSDLFAESRLINKTRTPKYNMAFNCLILSEKPPGPLKFSLFNMPINEAAKIVGTIEFDPHSLFYGDQIHRATLKLPNSSATLKVDFEFTALANYTSTVALADGGAVTGNTGDFEVPTPGLFRELDEARIEKRMKRSALPKNKRRKLVLPSRMPILQIAKSTSGFYEHGADYTKVRVFIKHASKLKVADLVSQSSDPFCVVTFAGGIKASTKIVQKDLNPIWNESFEYWLHSELNEESANILAFEVFDWNRTTASESIGKCSFDLNALNDSGAAGGCFEGDLRITNELTGMLSVRIEAEAVDTSSLTKDNFKVAELCRVDCAIIESSGFDEHCFVNVSIEGSGFYGETNTGVLKAHFPFLIDNSDTLDKLVFSVYRDMGKSPRQLIGTYIYDLVDLLRSDSGEYTGEIDLGNRNSLTVDLLATVVEQNIPLHWEYLNSASITLYTFDTSLLSRTEVANPTTRLTQRIERVLSRPEPQTSLTLRELLMLDGESLTPLLCYLDLRIESAKDLIIADRLSKSSDPFVRACFNSTCVETPYIEKNLSPEWNFNCQLVLELDPDSANILMFKVFDWNPTMKSNQIGSIAILLDSFFAEDDSGSQFEGELKLRGVDSGNILVSMALNRVYLKTSTDRTIFGSAVESSDGPVVWDLSISKILGGEGKGLYFKIFAGDVFIESPVYKDSHPDFKSSLWSPPITDGSIMVHVFERMSPHKDEDVGVFSLPIDELTRASTGMVFIGDKATTNGKFVVSLCVRRTVLQEERQESSNTSMTPVLVNENPNRKIQAKERVSSLELLEQELTPTVGIVKADDVQLESDAKSEVIADDISAELQEAGVRVVTPIEVPRLPNDFVMDSRLLVTAEVSDEPNVEQSKELSQTKEITPGSVQDDLPAILEKDLSTLRAQMLGELQVEIADIRKQGLENVALQLKAKYDELYEVEEKETRAMRARIDALEAKRIAEIEMKVSEADYLCTEKELLGSNVGKVFGISGLLGTTTDAFAPFPVMQSYFRPSCAVEDIPEAKQGEVEKATVSRLVSEGISKYCSC